MKLMKRTLTFVAALALLVSFCSCSASPAYLNDCEFLSAREGVVREKASELNEADLCSVSDFSVKLLCACLSDKDNEFISPLSVMLALAMVSNGASGDTLAEIEQTLGTEREDLNAFLNSLMLSLKNTDDASLVSTNSVWCADDRGLTVNPDFIDTVKKYYNAEIVEAPFGKKTTVNAINDWVKDSTDGMIDKVIDTLDADSLMVLLNALSFDALWANKFMTNAKNADFTDGEGNNITVKMMYGIADRYIYGENCVGFVKNYMGRNYSYVALLPNESIDMDDFTESLGDGVFRSLVKSAYNTGVDIGLPKYSADYSNNMTDILKSLGINTAFNPDAADFKGLGASENYDNIYISEILHKTHIEVDESGTRAAAVTAIIANGATAADTERKSVILNRPYVYAIVDNATCIPLFMGVVENPS